MRQAVSGGSRRALARQAQRLGIHEIDHAPLFEMYGDDSSDAVGSLNRIPDFIRVLPV